MDTWIESHQSLKGNKKTRKLARLLGLDRKAVIGLLHCLWWWAIDAAEDGDLTGWDAADIADECLYEEGDPDKLLDALINCGEADKPGFLERIDGRLLIHDWNDFAGKLVTKRTRDRDRKRKDRGSPLAQPTEQPSDNLRMSSGQAQDSARTTVGCPRLTVPNPTVQDRTVPDSPQSPPLPDDADTGGGLVATGVAVGEEMEGEARDAYRDFKVSNRQFPPREPSVKNRPGHLLWRIEMSNGALVSANAIGRELKAASTMLTRGYSEDVIVGHYEYQRGRTDKGYSLHLLEQNIASLHARSPGAIDRPAAPGQNGLSGSLSDRAQVLTEQVRRIREGN